MGGKLAKLKITSNGGHSRFGLENVSHLFLVLMRKLEQAGIAEQLVDFCY